jgi:uncharacterized protein YhaN
MRLISLDFERYGPFTNQLLTFQPSAKLHIVYGRNEAGKSCSLAAITDLLFGIEPRTRYDFLHEAKDMRIGATIEARDGSRLTFKRRKGNKNTLLDAAGAPLSDDALLPFLGSLSREVFGHAFGLNTSALRAGAEEMLRSEGEVGASLFAAASGLRGMTVLRRTLEAEADTVFAPRASKERSFYQALERFETARKAIRDLELKAGDWKTLNSRIAELSDSLEKIKVGRAQNAREQAKLMRLKRVAPLLRQIDSDIDAMTHFKDLPDIPPGLAPRLRVALDGVTQATETHRRAVSDYTDARRALEEIVVDDALIAKAAEIQRLFGETSAYAKDKRDMPRVQAEADEYSALLAQVALRLGLPDADEVQKKRPTDAALALSRSLASEGKAILHAEKEHLRLIASETGALKNLELKRAERGASIDPGPLREKFAALSPILKLLEKRQDAEIAASNETRSLDQAVARLSPSISDLDALRTAALPRPEVIGRYRQQIDESVESVRRTTERVQAISQEIATIEQNIETLASDQPLPSTEAVAAAREARDGNWYPLRDSLTGKAPLADTAVTDHIISFERNSAEADRLADAAATDADRVATYSAEMRRLETEKTRLADAKLQLAGDEKGRDEIRASWHSTWDPARLVPFSPAEMAVWSTNVQALFERMDKRDAIKSEVARIDDLVLGITPSLEALAFEAGLPVMVGLSTDLLAKRVEERIAQIAASWDEARDLETSRRDTQGRLDKLGLESGVIKHRADEWATRWCESTAAVGLPVNATTDEMEAALAAWQEVPPAVRERDNRGRRVAGMERNIEEFDTQSKTLVASTAPDLTSLPSDFAVKALSDRLTIDTGADAQRAQATRRLESARRTAEIADQQENEAKGTLSEATEVLPIGIDAVGLLEQLAEREKLADALSARRSQLIDQGDGLSEEQLRGELDTFDVDQSEARLQELAVDQEQLEKQAQEEFAARDRAVRDHDTLELGVGAEVVLQQRRIAEMQLVGAARRWAVLKLGSMLVEQVVDRHRASQKDPLMERAGVLFSLLTDNAFAGLDQDFDEDDTPRLACQRLSGELVPISGLSEGTRDQLYLALRLAYLEDYSLRAEVAPFIGDDLFTSFDEERTASGLAALSQIGDRVQPILFTHHKHVVDIARKTIGQDVSIIELC